MSRLREVRWNPDPVPSLENSTATEDVGDADHKRKQAVYILLTVFNGAWGLQDLDVQIRFVSMLLMHACFALL